MHAAQQSVRSAMNITHEDIQSLVREPSPAMRQRICEKISSGYNSGLYTDSETKLANEIFRLLLKDTEMKVRLLMAETLKSNMQVPHDIIWALANDRNEIAVPVLEHSHVLSEEDLITIARATREHPKLKAIARRDSISRPLSHALIEKRHDEITRIVLGNKGAAIADTSMDVVLEEFARDHSILEELVLRGGLPYAFAEKLFGSVSDTLKKQLTRKYRMNQHVVEEVAVSARETALLQFISPWMSQNDINHLVDEMHRNKRLTDSVIIRSLCIGDLRFFESAIAKRVGIPASNARILLIDPGALGFKALYESSGLPGSFYEAVHIMLRLALEETQYGNYRTNDFGAMMVAKIRSAGYDRSVENMETLLQMVGRAIHEPKLH
ncbi:MAG: DUF2336 domain-containing protein [Rickettsiales bacterium]|nr:DUF2336 domain-containing protein [Rickettsiales bacterium]